jgi:hypothetical protein
VTILYSISVSSSETEVKNEIKSWKAHMKKKTRLMVFISAVSEGLQLHRQINNLTISNGTLNAISSNTLRVRFQRR